MIPMTHELIDSYYDVWHLLHQSAKTPTVYTPEAEGKEGNISSFKGVVSL